MVKLRRDFDQSGLTLIEVLISIAILVFISIAIFQATTSTFKLRDVLSVEGDFYNGIRLAMNILDRDVSLLYSPILALPANSTLTPQQATDLLNSDVGRASQYWGPAVSANGIRDIHFNGSESKVSFISVSHTRVYKDAPESEFVKIEYTLIHDPLEPESEELRDTQVLVKTESPNAFMDDDSKDKLSKKYSLLRGIKSFKYRYYRRDKETWYNTWDTESSDFKSITPDAIELKIEVYGLHNLKFTGLYKFRTEVPLHGYTSTL